MIRRRSTDSALVGGSRLEGIFTDGDPERGKRCPRWDGSDSMGCGAATPLLKTLSPVRLAAALAVAGSIRPSRALRTSMVPFIRWKSGVHRGRGRGLEGQRRRDPVLRHAAARFLRARHPSELQIDDRQIPAVRLAAVVALRRQKAPEVATFLNDADPKVVAEAARAINDELITAALPKLAALITKPNLPRVVAYRVLNAQFLLGKAENAAALAAFAARKDVPDALRAVAVRCSRLSKPPRRDYITGLAALRAGRRMKPSVRTDSRCSRRSRPRQKW